MATRDSTRTRLLDAVDEVVFAGGDTHAPVDVILDRAGVSPATLYRAYGSKDDLVAAALDRRHAEWLEVWEAAVAAASTDRDRLLAVFDAIDTFRRRSTSARWCAFLGTAAGHVEPTPVLAAAVRHETETLGARLLELAEPVVGPAAPVVVEALVLLYSGELAMRLRPDAPGADRPRTRDLAGVVLDHADLLDA
ncbi:DNA-binding transcriptional regulator, AcrR family [Nocardioides exalbidus]|uniref:DNA-binding transcriptional regulator, AcrR family n=1 Tax=Nocardioides exalbidus TaxID=402596 RepID=A0A1H4I3T0_9ACTN|nr:TetR/AcrR family transcriptional regulator [Nocardioides exalbidus]SEB28570.1 DNA-binding transcriptional regulator, AcrR family [Nocardioides exalbidus]